MGISRNGALDAAHFPTDWIRSIPWGIYEVYKENPELGLDKMFEDAIL